MQLVPGTKRFILAQHYAIGHSRDQTFSMLRPSVEAQRRPWIFSNNVPDAPAGSKRIPKEIEVQLQELKNEIGRVWGLCDREGIPSNVRAASPPTADPLPIPEEERKEEKPKAAGKLKKEDEIRFFVSEWKRIRQWIAERTTRMAADTPIDNLDSMRPVLEAKRGIQQGIPARALVFAMVMHWPSDARKEAKVDDFDFQTASEDLGEDVHKLVGYILKLAKARIPILLVGSAGVGKGRIAREIAIQLDLDYGQLSMSGGATRGDFLGRHTIGGLDKVIAMAALGNTEALEEIVNAEDGTSFIGSQYQRCYESGGVFCFDEIDAADPNALMVLNDSIASEELFNSTTGRMVEKNADFVPVATANTFGLGANAQYTARDKLDFATLDRFRMGRVVIPLDEDLVEHLAFS